MSIFERSKVDEDLNMKHPQYDEYDRKQFIITLDVGESIDILVKDKEGKTIDNKTFTAKYINCHINCQWQDKGIKSLEEVSR